MPPDSERGRSRRQPESTPTKRRIARLGDSNSNIPKIRLQLLAGRLHGLGPYPLWRFLEDIESGKPIRPTLEEYASFPADFFKDNGADQFTPSVFVLRSDDT